MSFSAGVATAQETEADLLPRERADLAAELGDFASRLEHDIQTDDVGVAERLYTLEIRGIRLLETVARTRGGEVPRAEAMADIRALIDRILRLQERLQEHTIEKLDRLLPGEPGRQHWSRRGRDLYHPLYRLPTPVPGQPQPTPETALRTMIDQFHQEGGSDSDINVLGPRTIHGIQHGQLAEWVQLGASEIRFTTAGAKHPVIGRGRSVRGAGSMKIYRDPNGEVVMVVVSNSSGNYKPGTGSTEGLVSRLVELGIPSPVIVSTSVIPAEPALVKLLLKANGEPNDRIRTRIAELRHRAGEQVHVPNAISQVPFRVSGLPHAGRTSDGLVARSARPHRAGPWRGPVRINPRLNPRRP
jgi:hypothetical protein